MKKILFSLLAIALVLSLAATSVAAYDLKQSFINDETYVMGDSNGDGGVDGKDALALKATVAGMGGYDCQEQDCIQLCKRIVYTFYV